MTGFIPYGRQEVTRADIAAVEAVLRSDFLTQGPAVPRFEVALAAACGAKHAVAANSATSALHLACLALGLGPGDALWTSPNSFVASANCGLYCGARVDFVDIDPRTYNMCPHALEAKLRAAKAPPKVVVPVHFAGQPCDMAAIGALAQQYGFRVLEDASHAVGARDAGAPVGACAHSDIAVFSFHPVKIVTTGEGGAALTRDDALAARMALLRSHGVTRDPGLMTHAPEGPWCYQQVALGFNHRMTDMQAALGASQLERLGVIMLRRRTIAARYDAALAGLPLATPWQRPGADSAWHLYVIRLDDTARRRAVLEGLRARDIGVNVHYIPIHTQPHYRAMGFAPGDFPAAEAYYAGAISLPMFPTLTDAQQARVIEAVREEAA